MSENSSVTLSRLLDIAGAIAFVPVVNIVRTLTIVSLTAPVTVLACPLIPFDSSLMTVLAASDAPLDTLSVMLFVIADNVSSPASFAPDVSTDDPLMDFTSSLNACTGSTVLSSIPSTRNCGSAIPAVFAALTSPSSCPDTAD